MGVCQWNRTPLGPHARCHLTPLFKMEWAEVRWLCCNGGGAVTGDDLVGETAVLLWWNCGSNGCVALSVAVTATVAAVLLQSS